MSPYKSVLAGAVISGACLVFGTVAPAGADIITVTATGVITPGNGFANIDTAGIFGSPGADLNGDTITVVFTFDTSLGFPATQHQALGGTAYGRASPALSAVGTVNGVSVTTLGTFHGELDAFNLGPSCGQSTCSVFQVIADPGNGSGSGLSGPPDVFIASPGGTLTNNSIYSPFTYTVQPEDSYQAFFDGFNFDLGVELVNTSAVPGPIAGAGLPGLVVACGGVLAWWRRRATVFAARGEPTRRKG
jgi:hypothetical protein